MKKTKRFAFLSMLLIAVMLVLSVSVALADENTPGTPEYEAKWLVKTFTAPAGLEGHDLHAYQIFQCILVDGKLTEVTWGEDIIPANFIQAMIKNNCGMFTTDMDAAAVAGEISRITSSAGTNPGVDHRKHILDAAKAAKKGNGKALSATNNNTLVRGYYLIVDETDADDIKTTAANKSLLTYTTDVENTHDGFALKTDYPEVWKKVEENHKNIGDDKTWGDTFNDVADYTMGDAVTFRLYGTVPDMEHYDTYKYVFHDTLSVGLTAPAVSDIKVYMIDEENKATLDGKTTLRMGADKDYTATVAPITNDEGQNVGSAITVNFKNLKDVDGVKKGKMIVVEYDAVLNQDAKIGQPGNPNEVYLQFSNNPDHSGENDNANGETPPDKVIVFTYQINLTKIEKDAPNVKLAGAKFKLSRAAQTEEGKEYARFDAEKKKVVGWAATIGDGDELTSDADGLFSIAGLDDGTYELIEIEAPSGYVLPGPVELRIATTTENGQTWDMDPSRAYTAIKLKVGTKAFVAGGPQYSQASGNVAANIENRAATALPETGSVGTTIFTFGGLAMMMAAAIVFALRRREEA